MNCLDNATFEVMSRKHRNSALKEKWKSPQLSSQLCGLEHHRLPWALEGNTDKRDTEGSALLKESSAHLGFCCCAPSCFSFIFLAFCS